MLIKADASCRRDLWIILPPFKKPFEFPNLGDTEDMYLPLGGMGIGLTS